jgi:hypothetical protein
MTMLTQFAGSPPLWLDILAWILFALAARDYFASVNALLNHVDEHCPQLWDEIWAARMFPQANAYSPERRVRSLDSLILFQRAGVHYPTDPQFVALRSRARMSVVALTATLAGAIILLGLMDWSMRA